MAREGHKNSEVAKQGQRNRGAFLTSTFIFLLMVKKMKIKEIYWLKRFFYRNDSEKWRIEIVVYASEKEVQELREMESESVLKKLINL